ncbi:MAG TPA: dienelactone hydrolase family protein [Terriglobales bacterium]|nr:dienelactone hydrolase family protein [Terriglobales bacterium]
MTASLPFQREKVDLKVSDGTLMSAYVARAGDPSDRPGILVLQEAFGVNSHIRNLADRLALHGFVAIAPELFHRSGSGFEGDYEDFQTVMPHMQAITAPGAEADLRAAFDWLHSQPGVRKDEISSIGFCLGGSMSYLANSILPLRAAVSFYGGRIASDFLDRAPAMRSPILLFWGGQDQHIPAEKRRAVTEALTAAGKTYVNVEFSAAGHGFFCDERAAYHPRSARQAWSLTLEFLRG